MNVKQYRKRYEAEIKRAADAYKVVPAADTQSLLAGKFADPKARVAAIESTPPDSKSFGLLVEQYLSTLGDSGEAVAVRLAALDALKAADFLGPKFDAYRADFLQTLREVATGRSRKVRKNALEVLAMQNDPYAQDILMRGLKDPKAALVPLAKAIQFLSYDDHAAAVPIVRKVFKSANNTAKEEALRLLASDPDSEKLFTRLLKDKSQRSMIRQLSATGLQNLNPAAFKTAARKIVTGKGDYNEIRASCLAALTTAQESDSVSADEGFAKQVSRLKNETRSTNLRSSIKRFLQMTQK